MPPNPPSKAHGFAIRSMSLCDIQIFKSDEKKILGPPLPNPGDAPAERTPQKKNTETTPQKQPHRNNPAGITQSSI